MLKYSEARTATRLTCGDAIDRSSRADYFSMLLEGSGRYAAAVARLLVNGASSGPGPRALQGGLPGEKKGRRSGGSSQPWGRPTLADHGGPAAG